MTDRYDIVIVGAGPAGSSAAIHLSRAGLRCLIVEKSKFPRHKLCGEFVSPECLPLLDELDIHIDPMDAASIRRTVFYSANGNSLTVPSEWFAGGMPAFGISRDRFDDLLLNQALASGASLLAGAVTDVQESVGNIEILKMRDSAGQAIDIHAPLYIDATGRDRVISRQIGGSKRGKAEFVALKAHIRDAAIDERACEIYGYRGGYGGCNAVGGGVHNICFIVPASVAKQAGSDPNEIARRTILQNRRAAEALSEISAENGWLAVPIDSYGSFESVPAQNAIAIGDAGAFIDPFTGSGILMALGSARLAASAIVKHHHRDLAEMAAEYHRLHRAFLATRLRSSAAFRLAAFSPALGNLTVRLLAAIPQLARLLARSTRR